MDRYWSARNSAIVILNLQTLKYFYYKHNNFQKISTSTYVCHAPKKHDISARIEFSSARCYVVMFGVNLAPKRQNKHQTLKAEKFTIKGSSEKLQNNITP